MKNRFLIIVLLAVFSFSTKAQIPPSLPYGCEACVDSLILVFQRSGSTGQKESGDTLKYTYAIHNESVEQVLLFIGDPDYSQVNLKNSDGIETIIAGRYSPKSKLKNNERVFVPLVLKQGLNEIEVLSFSKFYTYHYTQPHLIKGIPLEFVKKRFETNNYLVRMMGLGVLILFGLVTFFASFNALITKNRDFKNYSIYALSIFLFLFLMTDWYSQRHLLFPEHPDFYLYLSDPAKAYILWIYLFFSERFLALDQNNLKAQRFLRILQHTLVLVGLGLSLTLLLTKDFGIVRKVSVIYLIPSTMCMILFYRIIKGKINNLRIYVLLGGYTIFLSFIASGVIALYNHAPFYRSYYQETFHGIMGFNVIQVGICIEMLVFLMAISIKNKEVETEKDKLQQLTLSQYAENEVLQKRIEKVLKERLEESQKNLKTELAKSAQQKNEMDLFKAQLMSLQLQMNPHYLFNSLNSINDFIISKKPQEASEYLALYARMMRNILKNSDQTFNTLEQELQFSKDYLELEALRFSERFEFKINLPDNKDLLNNYVPGMMLQPILENAIWHGIMPLQRPGFIQLSVTSVENEGIIIQIEDNGNGIKQSNKKESYGLKNIHEKIALLHKLYCKEVKISMRNKDEENGFLVKLFIPFFSDEVMN